MNQSDQRAAAKKLADWLLSLPDTSEHDVRQVESDLIERINEALQQAVSDALRATRALTAEWQKFADTDHTKGMKLGDARKQAQYELMMAGQSLAYATAAKQLEAALSPEPPKELK